MKNLKWLVVIAVIVFFVYEFFFNEPSVREVLEFGSVDFVTEIIQDNLDTTVACEKVSIEREVSEGFYEATAYLDNDKTLRVTIELDGEDFTVTIPALK